MIVDGGDLIHDLCALGARGVDDDVDNDTGGAVIPSGQTVVFFEIGGVPANECLTFRNNGASASGLSSPRRVLPVPRSSSDPAPR